MGLEVELEMLDSSADRPNSHLSRDQDCGRELATKEPCLQRKEQKGKDETGRIKADWNDSGDS